MYNKINNLCKLKHTTITQLCIDVTGSSGNLSTWKKGYMRSDYLLKVAQILDVSVDYLLGRTDNLNSHKEHLKNTVNGNYNAVDNSSVMVTTTPLNEHQKALLDIYNKLNPVQQAQLLVEAYKMADK